MIVTRQRKQKKSSLPVLLPIAALVMLTVALTWPPSRNFITNGPLHPVAVLFDSVSSVVARPLTFAYQQQQISDRNIQIKDLNDQLEAERKASADKDAQVQQLQKQMAQLQAQPEATAAAEAAPVPAASGAAAGFGTSTSGTSDALTASALKRDAAQWAAMDPDAAAALVQRLPQDYVARVFAQMPADSVGPIMDSLPPKVAAQIVQAGAGAQISASQSR